MGAGLRPGSSSGPKRLELLAIAGVVALVALLVWAVPALSGGGQAGQTAARAPDRSARGPSLAAQATGVPSDQVSAQTQAATPHRVPAPVAPAEVLPPVELPAAQPAPVVEAQSSHPAPQVSTVKYGPIPVLPAILGQPTSTMAGAPLMPNIPLLPMPCANCYVTGVNVDMVYDNGQQANLDSGVMLHHLVLFQSMLDDATCARTTPIGFLGQRVFAAGNERTAGALPDGYGVHFGNGPLGAVFDIMNHSDELKTVYLTATISWLPDSTPGIKQVTPVWLDQKNCATSTYEIPAGPTSRTWRWTSTKTGRFVAAGGHVHDGGIKTAFRNESTGEHICSSVAGYGTKPAYMGSIESMSVCSWDRLGSVRAGDVIAMDTEYNSPMAMKDVMGIMIAYLYETDDLTGGSPAPESVNNPAPTTSAPPEGAHHHHG